MSLVEHVETEEHQKLLKLVAAQHEETCKAIDPSIFPKGKVPMKSIGIMEKMENSSTAGLYYVMARRREHVKRPFK